MAERRMFTQKIIDSDAFLDMPLSTQALYFHLNMRADDDGFVNNPKRIQRTIGASEDDLKLLIAKRFCLCFETGVIVIKHWRMHNTIRKDRYSPTQYQEELARLELKNNNAYTEALEPPDPATEGIPATIRQPSGNQLEPQVRLGKDRLGKGRLEEDRLGECEGEETADEPPAAPHLSVPYETIKKLYNTLCPSFSRCTSLSDARKKAIKARFTAGYDEADFETLFRMAEASSFLKGRNNRNWIATFDWLIKDANMAKVLDGNYDDKGGERDGAAASDHGRNQQYGTYL